MAVQETETTPVAPQAKVIAPATAPKTPKAAKAAPQVAPTPTPAPKAKTTTKAAPAPIVIQVQQPTVTPAVVTAAVAPVAATAPVPKKKPAPSGVNIETSQLVKSIGMMLLGGGIIAATVWYFGVDMIVMALYIALPLLCLLVGFRLISSGTLQLIWNGELAERVDAYVKSLSNKKAAGAKTTV